MQTTPYLLSCEEADAIGDALDLFLVSYQALAKHDEDVTHAMLWKIVPKFLYMSHIADDIRACRLNPRWTGCSYDEDYLGKLKRVVTKTHPKTCMWRALQRLVLNWAVRWERRRRQGRFRL